MTVEMVPFGDLFAEPTRNGLTRPKAVRGAGTKMVNMGELFAHPRLCNASMDRVPLSDSEAERFLLEEGDLLFARQSLVLEGAGKCSIFLGDSESVTFESHVIRVRLDRDKADPKFYYYYFQSHYGKSAIRSIVEQGAGASGIRGSDLRKLDVQWPPLDEQRAIAHVLGTLDDKIELNRQMNRTLDEIARTLFTSWFVNFDPVRAKADGREPEGMDAETAALFPDRFVDSELGSIPAGWEVASIYDAAAVVYGAAFSSSKFNSEYVGTPLLRIRDLATHSPGIYTDETHPRGEVVEPGDIVVGMDGGFRAHLWTGPDSFLNQRVCKFVPLAGIPKAYVRYAIEHPLDFFERAKSGTTVIHLGKADINTIKIVLPDEPILGVFQSQTASLLDLIVSNAQASQTLTELRDTVLPELISGRLRLRGSDHKAVIEDKVLIGS